VEEAKPKQIKMRAEEVMESKKEEKKLLLG
jgi:hypothetical protein